MVNTLIGQKLDQTQKFLENGNRVPLTEISVVDNIVLQIKTLEKDKYSALQLGVGAKKKPTKGFLGHAAKAGVKNAPLKIKEVKVDGADVPTVGEAIKVDGVFKPGDIVSVTGVSKGKGFAGVVKRHGFAGGPKTHGQSDRHRAPGAIGQGTTPGRVYKGKRMAGRMGQDKVTVANLVVLDVDSENNKLYVSGLIPGNKNSFVSITKTGEKKKFVPLFSDKEEKETQPSPEASTEAEVLVDKSASEAKEPEVTEEVKTEEKVEPEAEVKTEETKTGDSKEVRDVSTTVVTPDESVKTALDTVETSEETVKTAVEEVKPESKGPSEEEVKDAS